MERNRGEQEQAAANFAALIESTNDLIWSVDLDYRLLTFNRALQEHLERSFGVRPAAGMTPVDYLPPARAVLWPPMYRRALAEGPFLTEYALVDGRTLELAFNPVVLNGRKTGISVFGKDITERKIGEKALRDAEKKYREIFDHAVVGIYQMTVDGQAITINPELARLLGYASAQEFIAATKSIVPDASARSQFTELLEERGTVRGYECPIKRKDGTTIWLSLSGRKVSGENGNTRYYEGFIEDISERKHIEEELQKSEEKFAALFWTNPIPSILAEPDGRYVEVNQAFEQATGYRRKEVIGRRPVEFGLFPDRAVFADFRRQLLATGRIRQAELQFRRKDGSPGTCLASGTVIEIEGRTYTLTTSIDITERKQAENVLREREEQYHALFENMHSGCIVFEVIFDSEGNPIDHRLLDANTEFEVQTGLKRSEEIGRTSTELTLKFPNDVAQRYYEVAVGGKPFHWERFNESLQRYSDVRVFSPRKGQFALLFNDITERRRQEDLLRMLSSAVTSASDAIVITDNDLSPTPKVLYANPAFTRLTGYTTEELIDHRTNDTFGVRIDSKSAADIREVLLKANAFHGEVTNCTKDGRFLQLELDIVPVHNSAGEITHFVAVRRDISRRKAEELDRQRLLQLVLEAQTEERRRVARELHDHTGQLLTSMLLRLNVLEASAPNAMVKRAVQEISSVASSTLEDISRLARGLHPAVLEDLGLTVALRRAVEEFGATGISASFEMTGITERLPGHVEHEIYQIVKEALTNIQKHSQANRVEVLLEKHTATVTATINDNGIGFDAREPGARGSHLGIVGMSERAKLLGGSLLVTSAQGEGTTITLTVPLLNGARDDGL